jgi:colanic acid/amylovoran biosynthesis glycosyltransferase
MRIAYLINQYPQSSQSFIRREIAALTQLGVEVQRFTVRRWDQKLVDPDDQKEEQLTRAVLDEGKPKLFLAFLRTLFNRPLLLLSALKLAIHCARRGDRGIAHHLIYLAEACVLLRWFSEAKIEHIHAHFGTNSTTVAMLVNALGGPMYSFTVHGPEEFDRPIALKLGLKVHRSAFTVAISEYGRSQLLRWCDFADWPKVKVVHCGVDASFLNHPPTPVPLDSKKFVCIGRLAEQKGQLVLVQAAAKLAAEGQKFELVLVGDGPLRPEIQRLIDQHQLQQTVRIAGWMSNNDVRQQLLESRAMVLASFAEGLPVVVMEALALRRPVISTYVAGIPELVEPDQSGWLVPAGAVDPLVAALRDAITASPQHLDEMGAHGGARVAQQHDAITEARKLLGHFESVHSK